MTISASNRDARAIHISPPTRRPGPVHSWGHASLIDAPFKNSLSLILIGSRGNHFKTFKYIAHSSFTRISLPTFYLPHTRSRLPMPIVLPVVISLFALLLVQLLLGLRRVTRNVGSVCL